MTDRDPMPRRPSVLRFTRMMAGLLRQKFPVEPDEAADEFVELLRQAERRREIGEKAGGD